MSISSISKFTPNSTPGTASHGTPKPKNKTDEAAQKQISELSATAASTALTNVNHHPKQVRWFKDHSSPHSYDSFYKLLSEALGAYNSTDRNNFASPLLRLIAEYEDEITAPSPILSVSSSLTQGSEFISSIGFGKKMWNDYFGDIGEAPPLPKDLCAILKSDCPFFKGKTVEQTHMLVLVPATLDGTAMTLKRLGDLMRGLDLKQGKTGYKPVGCDFETYAETPFEKSHWVLMTNTVLEETRSKSYAVQKGIIELHANYQVPKLAQAAVAIFMEYVVTSIHRFGKDPMTYTGCQEAGPYGQMLVGGFAPAGLHVVNPGPGLPSRGVAALRKFF